ncbi:MAG: hypothetical protein NHB14_20810 [Desulfosporosinus sp.]|nr:hypothetical protein [Desulfosporosinus sp.]
MYADFFKYHGAVLLALASTKPYPAVNKLEGTPKGEYQINPNLGLYIKHSISAKKTWTFNFQPTHQDAVKLMAVKYHEKIFIALVCVSKVGGKEIIDGVCLLSYVEFLRVAHPDSSGQKSLTVRRDGGSYWVSGPAGKLPGAVAQIRFPQNITELIIS